MKRFILTTAMTVALAVPAAANDQLAMSLGVEPGEYTLSELVQLQTAMEEGDQKKIDFIMAGGGTTVPESAVSPAQIQLATELNVDPANFSYAELVQLRQARLTGDIQEEGFILSGENDIISTQSFVSPGQAQIAASLGLDPTEYTLAELASIAAEREDSE